MLSAFLEQKVKKKNLTCIIWKLTEDKHRGILGRTVFFFFLQYSIKHTGTCKRSVHKSYIPLQERDLWILLLLRNSVLSALKVKRATSRKMSKTLLRKWPLLNILCLERTAKATCGLSYRLRWMCCVLVTNLTRKFAVDLSVQIFLIHYISR